MALGPELTPPFRGRSRERHELDRLLDTVRGGRSAVLVIRGEAGIGKTALLQYCARQALGFRVARVTGVQSELELPFAALHQLCRPMLEKVAALPEPQAKALRVAFGLAAGGTPDRFMVGLAVLSLLAEEAAERPLMCLVDDAQWLDEPTAQVLGFVGRRLLAESILFLFAVREAADHRLFPGLPTMTLEGLTDDDARALLIAAVPGHLDEHVRDRIVAETRGNPLALLELPKGISPGELAGGFALAPSATVSGQLYDRYVRRVRALPAGTQRLLLLAAAEPTGNASLLWRAADALNVGDEAAVVADQENLLKIDSRVQFRHPLVRSAAYATASSQDRSAVHQALADATDAVREPERRVWHLAAAAAAPDEAVADALERMAVTAQTRAGLAAAAAFLERSLALTAEPTRRADRALAAAAAHLHAGAFDAARGLLARAAGADPDALQRARVEQLSGQIEAASKPGSEAPLRLLYAARRLESLDIRLARETYLQAWWAAVLAGRYATPGGDLAEVCRAARAAPQPTNPQPCDLLLDGLATLVTDGCAAAVAPLRSAVDLFLADGASDNDWIQWGRSATTAAYVLWDFDSWAELSGRHVARARDSGALSSLVLALNFHPNVITLTADLEAATALVAEQVAVKEATGIRIASSGARLLSAYRGRPVDPSTIDDEFVERGEGYAVEGARLGAAVLNNGIGRYAEACGAARDVVESASFYSRFALPELIEAAVRVGRADTASDALRQLSELIVETSDWSTGIEARCRALVADGEEAEHWYTRSITHLARTPIRMELARSQLLYGEWLRRALRRADARRQLRTAYDLFASVGAEPFAERARSELFATGERVRKRDVSSQNELTSQEQHIARLARDGHSNREIAAQLFISARTVEWHLSRIFGKLAITSRNDLHGALLPGTVR